MATLRRDPVDSDGVRRWNIVDLAPFEQDIAREEYKVRVVKGEITFIYSYTDARTIYSAVNARHSQIMAHENRRLSIPEFDNHGKWAQRVWEVLERNPHLKLS